MLKRSLMLMMAALLLIPAAASSAADAEDLHGRWELKTVEFNGQTEDAPAGAVFAEFHADGTAKMLVQGEEPETGTYTVQGNQIVITNSQTGEVENVPFTLDGDTLVLDAELAPGQVAHMSFERVGDVENRKSMPFNAALLDATNVHGKWDMRSTSVDGQVIDEPEAGSVIVEFYPDGTMKLYDQGELVVEGTFTVADGKLTVTAEGDASEPTAYERDGDQLTLMVEVMPGKMGQTVFERLGDAGSE